MHWPERYSVLAVMGPSGAGKSTFVSALADKAPYGQRLGKVFINGVERSLSQYSSRVGFVPQEDIMLRTQTVEETLKHCAATRLPPSWSDSKKVCCLPLATFGYAHHQ